MDFSYFNRITDFIKEWLPRVQKAVESAPKMIDQQRRSIQNRMEKGYEMGQRYANQATGTVGRMQERFGTVSKNMQGVTEGVRERNEKRMRSENFLNRLRDGFMNVVSTVRKNIAGLEKKLGQVAKENMKTFKKVQREGQKQFNKMQRQARKTQRQIERQANEAVRTVRREIAEAQREQMEENRKNAKLYNEINRKNQEAAREFGDAIREP